MAHRKPLCNPIGADRRVPLQDGGQIELRHFRQQVEMVGHEHPDVHPPAATAAGFLQALVENEEVVGGFENRLAAAIAGHDVMDGTGILEAQLCPVLNPP